MNQHTITATATTNDNISIHQQQLLKTNFQTSYPDIIVDSHKVPNYSLDQFYNSFFHDNAPYSMEVFQRNIIEDQNIDLSAWTTHTTNTIGNNKVEEGFQQQKRILAYLHPRKAMIGPGLVHTKREQVCTRVSSLGIILDMKTEVDEKVPYGDYFFVQEGWLIEPCTEQEGGGVKISIRLNIKFVKSTMIRKIIIGQVKEEGKKWFKLYFDYLASLEDEADLISSTSED
jgi:hypothetical protein